MLAHKYFDYRPSLYQARTVAFCLTAFAGFLRYDELSNLLCLDVKFYPDHFLLFIESSKSDQYRDGAWVPISSSNLITCPLRALKRYADLGEIVFDSDLPLFRGINGPNAKAKLRSKLSYSRVRELVKEAFKDCIDSTLIGVHSLRAGGASAAANNGIPDRLFKRHGRWLSEKAKDGHVKDDLKERSSVTRSLGI